MSANRPLNVNGLVSCAGAGAAALTFFGRGLAVGAVRLAGAARLAGRVGAGVGRFFDGFDGCGFRARAPLRPLMAFLKRR